MDFPIWGLKKPNPQRPIGVKKLKAVQQLPPENNANVTCNDQCLSVHRSWELKTEKGTAQNGRSQTPSALSSTDAGKRVRNQKPKTLKRSGFASEAP